MANETPTSELKRLGQEQDKTRRDEVFGGLSAAERAEYDVKRVRIHALEREIQASAAAEEISKSAKADNGSSGTNGRKQIILRVRLASPTAAAKRISLTTLLHLQRDAASTKPTNQSKWIADGVLLPMSCRGSSRILKTVSGTGPMLLPVFASG